ncbi:hypothetical protein Gotur_028215, partial [Gossypium turneri]
FSSTFPLPTPNSPSKSLISHSQRRLVSVLRFLFLRFFIWFIYLKRKDLFQFLVNIHTKTEKTKKEKNIPILFFGQASIRFFFFAWFSIPKNILISPFYSWNLFRSAFISLHLHQGTVFFSFNSSFGVGLGF